MKSYGPISLLPIMPKILERLLPHKLLPILAYYSIISQHQFGFKKINSITDQIHRIINEINATQASEKVWHVGLFYKL